MKYIDAEKLRAEIERLYYNEAEKDESILAADAYKNALEKIESFIDSSPDENNPEPYNPVYDEDYLNEKIAKATKSWEGVDVDAMLAECRGYEEPDESLEEAAEEYDILSIIDSLHQEWPKVDLGNKFGWHNVSEETPEFGDTIIVACKNKNKEDGIWLYDLIHCWEGKWEPRENWETPLKWISVDELGLNTKKEE